MSIERSMRIAGLSLEPKPKKLVEVSGYRVGMKFYEWTVDGQAYYEPYIEQSGKVRNKIYVPCKCSCGKKVNVRGYNLSNNGSKCCGCKRGLHQRGIDNVTWEERQSKIRNEGLT